MKFLVMPYQMGLTNTPDVHLSEQRAIIFDVIYWFSLINQSSLTDGEKAKLIETINNNSDDLLKWRQAMATAKKQEATYDHPLFHIENLYLSINQLQSFNGAGLEKLKELYLSENQLQNFDGTGLVNLRVFYLPYNKLQSFDGTPMPNLKILNINNNPYLTNNQQNYNGTAIPNSHA